MKNLNTGKEYAAAKMTKQNWKEENTYESAPLLVAIMTYLSFAILTLTGLVHNFMVYLGIESNLGPVDINKDFVDLYRGYESFFTRHIYSRARYIFGRPVCSRPGVLIDVEHRLFSNKNWQIKRTGQTTRCINLGSYDYLGFADNNEYCRDEAITCILKHGVASSISRRDLGQHLPHQDLEITMSNFLETEDCITFGMGFATNACNIQCLVSKDCLVLSDEFNHSSLVLGVRMSGARVVVFPHDDLKALERIIRDEIINGHPKSHRPYKKILIIVEGVYSMEGTICNLPELIRIKKKYKAYIYLDEAHSIGAVGPRARGVVDYFGCNPNDIDVLMGTFTKSFSSCGGYIAGSKKLINHIRTHSHANLYASDMSPPICQQIISAISIITGKCCGDEGMRRINAIAWNSKYLYNRLKEKGFIVYGQGCSPVIPILVYLPGKLIFFANELYKRGLAVVGVGFPATKLVDSRIRLCLSANLTKPMLDKVVEILSEVGSYTGILYNKQIL